MALALSASSGRENPAVRANLSPMSSITTSGLYDLHTDSTQFMSRPVASLNITLSRILLKIDIACTLFVTISCLSIPVAAVM